MSYNMGDPFQDFGDFANKEYGEEAQNIARRNAGVKPAGLQGVRGYENYNPVSDFETGQLKIVGPTPSPEVLDKNLTNSESADLAIKGAKSLKGFLEKPLMSKDLSSKAMRGAASEGLLGELDSDSAFAGFEGASNNIIDTAKSGAAATPTTGDWTSFFNAAAQASTQEDLTVALAKAVASVPDNTSIETKKKYFQSAKELIERKRNSTLPALDIKYVTLQSNIGWLLDPRIAKSGGFDRAIMKAVSAATVSNAQKDEQAKKNKLMVDEGKQLKTALQKVGKLAGFDGLGGTITTVALLGVSAAAAFYAWKHFSKKHIVASRKNRKNRKAK